MVTKGWYVFFSSWITINTAVFFLPISSISKSLQDSISDKFFLDENNFIFCLNTDKILPFVSVGAIKVLEAFT